MADTSPKTRRILRAVNLTTLSIAAIAAGRMVWEICGSGADSGNILLLCTFLVTGISSILQLANLRKQARREPQPKQ